MIATLHCLTSKAYLRLLRWRSLTGASFGKGTRGIFNTRKMQSKTSSDLPPGFRFHPTDEELIMYYLLNQATYKPVPVSIIAEVDIYKFDPWQLPEKAEFGENEWYFFSPRDRKYQMEPPKGIKTDWIMHEYRLNDSRKQANKQNRSMRLDDWVLCRIYKKRHTARNLEEKIEIANTQLDKPSANEQQILKFSKTCSLTNLLEFEYMGSISQLLNDKHTIPVLISRTS
ncbi:hypothetical protein GH714_030935 [Hevea brasiliensis]|uniref:NAC domain-containing protein n=1 Tax=Hevea brasiliensis TaxID=3981 RepID=A0A6A6LCP1_HEVBR|nr:hypothetical protein GH714_030935 [Hevea brasiliensis]